MEKKKERKNPQFFSYILEVGRKCFHQMISLWSVFKTILSCQNKITFGLFIWKEIFLIHLF